MTESDSIYGFYNGNQTDNDFDYFESANESKLFNRNELSDLIRDLNLSRVIRVVSLRE